MKVLFIANNQTNDFLSDAVFHGLNQIESVEVIDANYLWYMYNDIDKNSLVNRFHGRGFTYYTDIPFRRLDREGIETKIKDHHFDKIIYGNIRRCNDYLDVVFDNYSEKEIIFLDGNDEHNQPGIYKEFVNLGTYFRRELSKEESEFFPSAKPISFAYPEKKMPSDIPNKEKVLAQIIPGVSETFTFNDEVSYFEDYRKSLFAYTWRKAGWDCLRHYEILGNDCIPIFLDIEHCPSTVCTTIPKEILKEYYKKSGIYDLFKMDSEIQYNPERSLVTNRDLTLINEIDMNEDFFTLYFDYLNRLRDYNVKNITTKKLAEYVIA